MKQILLPFFSIFLVFTATSPSMVHAKSAGDDVKSTLASRESDDDDDQQVLSERDSKRKCLKAIHKKTRALYSDVRSACKASQTSAACIQAKAELEIKKAAYQEEAKSCLTGVPAPVDPVPTPVPTPTPPPAASCQFNGKAVASGQSVNAFQASSVPFGQTCASQSRLCTNGVLAGSYQFAACTVAPAPVPPPTPTPAPAASCQFNGQAIASGQNVNAFQASSVPFGQTCSSQARTCTNGVLSGTYQFASCSVAAAASCQFNGQTVASGQSVNAFQAASVPFATTCTSQARTCNNGTLSGSYTFASCTVAAAPAIDGAAIYTQNCASCHGALATSNKRGKSAATITSAIQNVGAMKSNPNIMALTPAQIDAIAKALGN